MKYLLTIIFLFTINFNPNLFANEASIDSLRDISKAFSSVAKKSSPAVVFIQIEKRQQAGRFMGHGSPFGDNFLEFFFRGSPNHGQGHGQHHGHGRGVNPNEHVIAGQGSGFIISEDGYILTNNHVVGDADRLIVKLLDGRKFKAKIIGSDKHSDIAVIKIDADNLPTLPLGNSEELEVGEWVVALGNPFGLSHSLTAGIVSAKGRSSVGITNYENFIQTDAAINPGNSGGPLINLNGQAVGMNTAIFSRSGGYMGIGFAIPINMVKRIKEQLIASGSVVRGYLGVVIQNIDNDLASQFNLGNKKGILISDVAPNSPADAAGLKVGDVIVKFDGKDVKEVASFRNQVALTSPNKTVKIKIIKDGGAKTLKVKLGKLPGQFTRNDNFNFRTNDFGIAVDELSEHYRRKYQLSDSDYGVIVTHVDPQSSASMEGIKAGNLIKEVNRIKIKTVYDFKRALKKSKRSKSILLLIKADRYSRYITLSK